jgi:hypothetical protein
MLNGAEFPVAYTGHFTPKKEIGCLLHKRLLLLTDCCNTTNEWMNELKFHNTWKYNHWGSCFQNWWQILCSSVCLSHYLSVCLSVYVFSSLENWMSWLYSSALLTPLCVVNHVFSLHYICCPDIHKSICILVTLYTSPVFSLVLTVFIKKFWNLYYPSFACISKKIIWTKTDLIYEHLSLSSFLEFA